MHKTRRLDRVRASHGCIPRTGVDLHHLCRLHLFDTHYKSDDGSLKPNAHINQFLATLEEGCKKLGKELYPGPLAEGWLKDAGFVNVHVQVYKIPLGPWPKDKKMVSV